MLRKSGMMLAGALLAAQGFAQPAATPPRPPVVLQADGGAALRYSAEDEAVYSARFRQLQESFRLGLGLETYDPLEAVPGARRDVPLPVATAQQRTIRAEALEAARRYAEENRSTALIVWRRGRVEAAHYFGTTTRSTTFPSRSLAKPMTAVAVGRAIALGRIRSLDQPVADFVTEWRGDPRRSRILVRHLLDMRSGFLAQDIAPLEADILNRAYLHPRHEAVIINDYPVVDEPGTRYEYNNATSEMVAVLIERATGRRYAEFISTEILQPIGALGGQIWVNRPGGVAHSGCCLLVPAETWLRLGILVMQDGTWNGRRLLPEGYVVEMGRGTPQYPYYGLGLYVGGTYTARRGFANPDRLPDAMKVLHSEPYLASDVVMFDGNANQIVYIVPSEQLVILRVGDNPRRGGREWDNSVLPNTIMRGIERRAGEKIPPPQPRPER